MIGLGETEEPGEMLTFDINASVWAYIDEHFKAYLDRRLSSVCSNKELFLYEKSAS